MFKLLEKVRAIKIEFNKKPKDELKLEVITRINFDKEILSYFTHSSEINVVEKIEKKEAKLIPEMDTKPALYTQGQILSQGTRDVNKKVKAAISNNKPFLDILKDVAGGEYNKYFSYQIS